MNWYPCTIGQTLLEKLRTLFTETRGLDPEKIIPTVGMNILKMEALQAKLVIWDLGGQGGLRSIWDKYFDETNALIWVVDASDRVRLRDSQEVVLLIQTVIYCWKTCSIDQSCFTVAKVDWRLTDI